MRCYGALLTLGTPFLASNGHEYATRRPKLITNCQAIYPKVSLQREADAAQEVRETRIASQPVESGIHPDEGHSIRTGEIGLLEPGEGALLVAQRGVYARHVESANVALPCLCLDRA
jgi:hypothetical protein